MRLEFEDANEVVKYFANELFISRGVKTTNPKNRDKYKNELGGEVTQQFFVIKNPKKVLISYDNHKYYKSWLYGEILSEMLNIDPPLMYKYKPELFPEHYELLEDGRMQYMYSSRFNEFNQFVNVYRKLKENPNSKRLMVSIFTPYDTATERTDAPCTLGYNFLQREGKLNMTVFYRSHDFFGGFKSYDFGLSSFILQSFCAWTGLGVGNLGIYENSLHYYNRDQEQLEKLVLEVNTTDKKSNTLNLGVKNYDITKFYKQLRAVKSSEEASYNRNLDLAESIGNDLDIPLFEDMAHCYYKRNKRFWQIETCY